MKRILFFLLLIPSLSFAQTDLPDHIHTHADELISAAMGSSFGWERLNHLVDYYGPRFSGSETLENSIDWIVEEMQKDGFDRVWTQPVKVPWRGISHIECAHRTRFTNAWSWWKHRHTC